MRYLPHTEVEIRQMLERIGVASIDELFKPIPEAHSFKGLMQMEPSLDEPRLMAHLNELAAKNTGARALSFLGAGMYDHHIPPALDQLLMRSEFYTAYTPYQAELSQGTLQAIFEFQTTVCELLGMEVIVPDDCIGDNVERLIAQMNREKQVMLLENLRFHAGE